MGTLANGGAAAGVLNLERELVCFICTEILFQPLTLIDCLHTFCGSCLAVWFSHQHRKASTSHAQNPSLPYTCPTCRAQVKDTKPNAMVNTWLDMILATNPSRARDEQDKKEQMEMYKPGDNIMPKVSRRRDRRTRRDEEEVRERQMIEAATEESLRELQINTPRSQSQSRLLTAPAPPRNSQNSRSRDREREERRQRRRVREEERRARRGEDDHGGDDSQQEAHTPRERRSVSPVLSPPTTSPRHPDAVEARSRQQTVVHQASLVSLISSSESTSGTNTNDSIRAAQIMQEIIDSDMLAGVNVDALTDAEQDLLAERIAEEYRRRVQAGRRTGTTAMLSTSGPEAPGSASANPTPDAATHQHRRRRSASATIPREQAERGIVLPPQDLSNRPQSARAQSSEPATVHVPPASITGQRRRQHSNHSQPNSSARGHSRPSSPAAQSARSELHSTTEPALGVRTADQATFAQRASRPMVLPRNSAESRSSTQTSQVFSPLAIDDQQSTTADTSSTPPKNAASVATTQESVASSNAGPRSPPRGSRSMSMSGRQAPSRFTEPDVTCYRCHRADIQYEIHKHCDRCDIDLCLKCYRAGRGCKHWYGFGHAAMTKFESLAAEGRINEQIELPHILVGRTLRRPHQSLILESKMAKDGKDVIPLKTMSDPAGRLQTGHFCDRCGSYADNCFWSCDSCNDGEWGFCRDCVNSHRCCTHPLLPIANRSSVPTGSIIPGALEPSAMNDTEPSAATLVAPSRISQPSSTTSVTSATTDPLPGYINLSISTHCDICSQAINLTYMRYHCPFHPSPGHGNHDGKGDYDICTQCYHNLVKTNRIRRDDGPAGWRKCPLGHRMIITTFEKDTEGCFRRIVTNDLVGGWKMTDNDIVTWTQNMARRRDQQEIEEGSISSSPIDSPTWQWREDRNTNRRRARTRRLSYAGSASSPTSPYGSQTIPVLSIPPPQQQSTHAKFPPDGGFGAKGLALWSWYPDEGDAGKDELTFPRGAEIREIVDVNGEWWEGVYAGEVGFAPNAYVRNVA